MNRDIHVVVLMGGWSSERDVSLTSGKGVAEALRERGWSNVTELDMQRELVIYVAIQTAAAKQTRNRVSQLRQHHALLSTSAIAVAKRSQFATCSPSCWRPAAVSP